MTFPANSDRRSVLEVVGVWRPVGLALLEERVAALGGFVGAVREPRSFAGGFESPIKRRKWQVGRNRHLVGSVPVLAKRPSNRIAHKDIFIRLSGEFKALGGQKIEANLAAAPGALAFASVPGTFAAGNMR